MSHSVAIRFVAPPTIRGSVAAPTDVRVKLALPIGAKGDKGDPGQDGIIGADGADGAQGQKGDPGPDGADGAQGPTGATGATGPAPSGTGLVSVTAGVLDTASTLRYRVAADASNLRTDIGLGSVDNTSDAGKPVSTAQASADSAVASAASSALTTHTGNTSNPHSVTKAQVGLGSVDNTSDASKPVSTAQAAADAAVASAAAADATTKANTAQADAIAAAKLNPMVITKFLE